MKPPTIYAQVVKSAPINLALSENPLGCSPRVLQTLRKITVSDLNKYPDTEMLIQTIAKKWFVTPENVLLGCGSEQIIKLVAQTFLTSGDKAIIQNGSFAVFLKECMLARAECKLVDVSEFQNSENAKVAFLCNPNNPTGVRISQQRVRRIVQALPTTVVVVDEANGEFMDDSFIPQAVKTKNALVLRTLSKAIGLAGLRVGFAIGSKTVIARLRQAQQPFPVSSVACKMAKEALLDDVFVAKTRLFIQKERRFLQKELTKKNLQCSRSITNNLLISTPLASLIIPALQQVGVGVIDAKFFPGLTIPGFRISIKNRTTNRLFLQKLDEALSCLPKGKLLRSKEAL